MDSNQEPEDQQPSPVMAEVVKQPAAVGPRKKSKGFGPLLLVLLLLALAGSVVVNMALFGLVGLESFGREDRVQEKFVSHQRDGQDKIAIITVEGPIISGEGFFKRQIDRAKNDEDLKAVVLRVNSPGGTINGSDYMLHHLRKLAEEAEISIVVSMGGIAASGGYYVSMAVGDRPGTIFAEPTTWTGSIGVVIPHYNLSELLKGWGVKEDSIASHRLKTMGSFAKPMTEEERKILQVLVDESFTRFKDVVKQGRPALAKHPETLDKLATGQIFTAEQAKKSGLVDKIGFLEDAIDRAIKLAGLDEENVKVVKYKPEPNLVGLLMGTGRAKRNLDLAVLMDLSTPRAYYLSTAFQACWMPAAAASR